VRRLRSPVSWKAEGHSGSRSSVRLLVTSSIANLAIPLSAIITGPVLARALGPDDRGALAAVLVPFVFSAFLVAFGIPEALTYFVARHPRLEARLTRVAIGIGLLNGILTAGVLWLLADVLLGDRPEVQPLFRALALTMPIYMVMGNIRAVVIGKQAFGLINAERWLRTISRTLAIVVAAFLGVLTVTSAAWLTEGTALAVTVVLLIGLRVSPRSRPSTPHTGAADLRPGTFTKYALQAWLGSLAGVLILRLDQTLMTPLSGTRELGYYAVAVAVAEVPVFAIQAITDIVFSKSARGTDPMLAARVSRCLVVLTVATAVVGCALMSWGLPLLYGSDFRAAVPMAQILLVGTVFSAVASVLGYGLLAVGRPGVRSAVQFLAVGVNLPLVFALVPAHGGVGAAWASAATYAVMALLTCAAFARTTRVPLLECLLADRSDLAFFRGLRGRGGSPVTAPPVHGAIDAELNQQGP
jgi:O-antigen/teichoic acid export membrane protein